MKQAPSASAWRTSQCRFFQSTGQCQKGAYCRFAHIDAEGKDWHVSSAAATSKAGAPAPSDPDQSTQVMPIFPKQRSPMAAPAVQELDVATQGATAKAMPAREQAPHGRDNVRESV